MTVTVTVTPAARLTESESLTQADRLCQPVLKFPGNLKSLARHGVAPEPRPSRRDGAAVYRSPGN